MIRADSDEGLGTFRSIWSSPTDEFSTAFNRYSHLDGVFPAVVNKGNRLVVSLDSVNGHTRSAFIFTRLQDVDVVDGLPITIVHLEPCPIRREARRKSQFIHFKSEAQE